MNTQLVQMTNGGIIRCREMLNLAVAVFAGTVAIAQPAWADMVPECDTQADEVASIAVYSDDSSDCDDETDSEVASAETSMVLIGSATSVSRMVNSSPARRETVCPPAA